MLGSKWPGDVWDEKKIVHELDVYLHNRLIMFSVRSMGQESHRAAQHVSVCLPNPFFSFPNTSWFA